MNPPMFSAPPIGNMPQQYLRRARMFRDVAIPLSDYTNGVSNWPKYALLTHAIELALKAFYQHSILNGKAKPEKQPKNHDLDGWYRLAIVYGLPDEPAIAANIELLNLLHIDHYTRYPQDRSTPVPEASTIADSTVDHLISQVTQRLNPR
jgi:hypothetical protein